MTAAQWRTKRARADSFVARVAGQPRVFVIGSDDDLAKLENLARRGLLKREPPVAAEIRGLLHSVRLA